jgi:6-phosphogluconate dehydrogenase
LTNNFFYGTLTTRKREKDEIMADGGAKNYKEGNRRVQEMLFDVGKALKENGAGSFDSEKSH